MSKVLGIDLGTTNSCMAVLEGSSYMIIENFEGQRTTPSVVNFKETNTGLEVTVGEVAKSRSIIESKNTISSIKTHMGEEGYKVKILGENYTPEQISAHILKKLKQDAEKKLGEKITEAVITVPAYFTEIQRKATETAAEIAGLKVLKIINEPTAAALACSNTKMGNVLIYDLGGGTFDISILKITAKTVDVLSTCGDNKLGGDDIDNVLINYLISEFKKQTGIDLTNNIEACQRLKKEVEEAKKRLSSTKSTDIILPYLYENNSLNLEITREKFESLIENIVEKTMSKLEEALDNAKMTKNDIDEIVMVGGSTRIPLVQRKVEDFFDGKELSNDVNPDEIVAAGAALHGATLSKGEKTLEEYNLISEMKKFSDITPLSLGVGTSTVKQNGEIIHDIFSILIKKDSKIPTKYSREYYTLYDYQTEVKFKIYQGENEVASKNTLLGELLIKDIRPALAGSIPIELTFEIDESGILKVVAVDTETNNTVRTEIKNSLLTDEEIKEIKRDMKNTIVK